MRWAFTILLLSKHCDGGEVLLFDEAIVADKHINYQNEELIYHMR